jgi:hypothetical protein
MSTITELLVRRQCACVDTLIKNVAERKTEIHHPANSASAEVTGTSFDFQDNSSGSLPSAGRDGCHISKPEHRQLARNH